MATTNLLHCIGPRHNRSWAGDGTDAVQSCPWCEIERLRAQLATAHGLLREACGSAFPMDDAETNYRILVPRQWLAAARAAGGEG